MLLHSSPRSAVGIGDDQRLGRRGSKLWVDSALYDMVCRLGDQRDQSNVGDVIHLLLTSHVALKDVLSKLETAS